MIDISAFRTEPDEPALPPTPEQLCRQHQDWTQPASRVMFCARCGHATGGSQGHRWAWCRVQSATMAHHFCCPGACELTDSAEPDPHQPCHPDPADYATWAAGKDAERENMAVWRDMIDEGGD